ncbi:ATP-binding protein [Pseudothermotoga thermarum]|uniref:4Fe-4S ferredoxin iron-sulfur binding domain protein n=1 Tax=Pseudothermotoga thermarum DSM 5069 TaxID=688269 RepID=F7YTX4_9THEM|nr:4Fe-4S binding protein [Pseudothermotoga thermarum]AEH51425.1 4Fe-4S ferredoxin iron-sulfur binding domain protein [Pseudothermotoga thermarum DSM 5069]
MKRKIVRIDEEKCNGCGLCVTACHEGAIQMINGKAKLVNEDYCDGLGACLPVCPTGAIEIIEVERNTNTIHHEHETHVESNSQQLLPCGCPGSMEQTIQRTSVEHRQDLEQQEHPHVESQLTNWPIQFKLINPYAKFLQDSHLLIAADCVAYAYANLHQEFIKGRKTIIGCPKLDELDLYYEKFLEILKNNTIKSITVLKMEVPCCNGIAMMVKQAMLEAKTIVPYSEITISIDGKIIQD